MEIHIFRSKNEIQSVNFKFQYMSRYHSTTYRQLTKVGNQGLCLKFLVHGIEKNGLRRYYYYYYYYYYYTFHGPTSNNNNK